MNKQVNKNVIYAAIGLLLLSLAYQFFENEFKEAIKYLFETNYLWNGYNFIVVVVFFLHALFINNSQSYDFNVLKGELPFLDAFLNVATYIAVGSTALSLLKGIYLQEVFEVIYFKNYQNYDLYAMIGVSVILLWFSITRVWRVGVEVVYHKPSQQID